jgi:hypothetical protein
LFTFKVAPGGQKSLAAGGIATYHCRVKTLLTLCLCLPTFLAMSAKTNEPVAQAKLPSREKLQLYLLMGQSNMAGRGTVEGEDKTPHPRVFCFYLSNGWQVAIEPLNHGEPKRTPGVGPGLAFGKAMADNNPDISIGLVPCAIGGTPLSRWIKGADLYERAVTRAREAMKAGTLKGVIWHQGEADGGKEADATSYGERLAKMISDLRSDLDSPSLPFVAGQIGEFLYERPDKPLPHAKTVNDSVAHLPQKLPHTGCALSKGLNHSGDQLHFDSASQREFGRRYAAEMLRLQSEKP